MTAHHHTVGLILAGGRSRRMAGQDKAFAVLGGTSLLEHAVTALSPQVDELLINSNAGPRNFARFGVGVIPDTLPDRPGPLAGILAGLKQFPADRLISVAVDLPFIPADLVARLHSGLANKPCAYASDGTRHALAVIWAPGTAGLVEHYLHTGDRKLKDFLDRHGQAVVFDRPDDRGLFININTPADLAQAEQELNRSQ